MPETPEEVAKKIADGIVLSRGNYNWLFAQIAAALRTAYEQGVRDGRAAQS